MGPWIAIVILLVGGLSLLDWLLHHPLSHLISGAGSFVLVVLSNRGKSLGLPRFWSLADPLSGSAKTVSSGDLGHS